MHNASKNQLKCKKLRKNLEYNFFTKDNELLKNRKKSGITAKLIIKNNYIQQLYKKWRINF